MKKYIIFLSFFLFSFSFVFAIDVDEKEVRSGGGDDVVDFINYTGRHDEIDTVEAIRGIGRGLGSAVQAGKSGSAERYSVIHAVDASVKEGLDADILILGSAVKVDHIDNLRLIIEGYLISAYNYSAKDAKTLAHFITIYNAVYRGKIDIFNKKYKSVVLQHLLPSKVGLAVKYSEWPGNTQIVIPLSDLKYAGTTSSIDTSTISDKEVVNKMKEQDDKDIDARKDMVELKEKEAEEARERAEKEKANALEKEKMAKDAKKDVEDAKKKEKEKQDALKQAQTAEDKAKKVAEDTKKRGDADQAEKEKLAKKATEDAEKARKEKEDAEAERKRKEDEAKKAQDEADKAKESAKREEEFAKEKEEDAQSDRKDIAKDTQKIIEDKKAEKKAETDALIASATRGYALKVVDPQTLSSSLVMLDLRNARQLKTSSLDTIKGRRVYEVGDNLMAIAGSSTGNGVVSLVLINQRTLEIAKQGDDIISEHSMLIKDGDYYYAVVSSGGKFYLGKFNSEIERQALSSMSISQYSAITATEQGILVQDEENGIHLLEKTELKDVAEERRSYTTFKNEVK